MIITVDTLQFHFPDEWPVVTCFDTWSFYRNQFQRLQGIKAVDLIALDIRHCMWLIEVKDYRHHARTKAIELADEIAFKVVHSLAALLPAQANANDENERQMAKRCLSAHQLRVVLHLEQPIKHSKLFPRAIDPANLKQQLKQGLKAIDPHPLVLETTCMGNISWEVYA
jgi:hypothetical protein